MKKVFLFVSCWLLAVGLSAQSVTQKLQEAFQQFESDSQLKHAISSLYVIDAATGKVVFDKNSQVGLAGASTQKIITSVTAFEILGRDFQYKTYIGYDGRGFIDGELKSDLFINGNGDPTLGSSRWESTKEMEVLKKITTVLKKKGIRRIGGDLWIDDLRYQFNPLPDGWIWQDIGNYYGAGANGFNWLENQYDLVLKPGNYVADRTEIIKTIPFLYGVGIKNLIKTGAKGTGDNGYIYATPFNYQIFATGTIPMGVNSFTISGSIPYPAMQFGFTLSKFLNEQNIVFNNKIQIASDHILDTTHMMMLIFDSIVSPRFDSINYWFLKKSVNLYGEALIKTIARQKYFIGSTDSGTAIVRRFWKDKGLDENELNIYDGSGLSPLNRITTHAQVEILKYAKTKDWFPYFYDALPEYNGMKMKSGTISDVKGFCGYQKSKDGKEYIFSFLVNNYNGKTSGVMNKMYKVLDFLK
jgi:serine-type D-Ala-D-Ala carboxypeptidase/endopeptidase (penicillin-binding protein 4)